MQLLKFYADWCGPCKRLAMTMDKMEFPYEVIPVSLDDNTDLAMTYGVRSIPTLILIDEKGEVVERLSDSTATKEQLLDLFVVKHV